MKTIYLILAATILVGCSQQNARNQIALNFKDIPPENITNIPGRSYDWLIKDSEGNIWYIYYDGANGSGHNLNLPKTKLFSGHKYE